MNMPSDPDEPEDTGPRVELPKGYVALTMATAPDGKAATVCGDEPWVRQQCAQIKVRSGGAVTMLWDDQGGKARQAGLGKAVKVVESDASDQSVRVTWKEKNAKGKYKSRFAWYPVEVLVETESTKTY